MTAKWSYRLTHFFLLAAAAAAPLFWLPLTTDFYGFNKLVLFYLLTGLALISWLVYNVSVKTVRITLSPLLLPLAVLALAAMVSARVNTPNLPAPWFSHAGIYLAGLIYCLLAATVIQTAPQVRTGLLLISLSLAAAAIAGAADFNPAGSALTLTSLLISWLPVNLVLALKTTAGYKKIGYFLLTGIILSGIILNGYKLLPGGGEEPVLLPLQSGWSIAVDTLKTKLFLGAGPGQFSQSFTQFKPLALNQDRLWNIIFTASANTYLEILTTMGLAGLTGIIWLIPAVKALVRRRPGTRITNNQLALVAAVTIQLILAVAINFTLANWILFWASLSLLTVTQKSKQLPAVKDVLLSLSAVTLVQPLDPLPRDQTRTGLLPWFLVPPVLLGLGLVFFNLGKLYAADYYFKKSLEAGQANKGTETYNLQIKAVSLAPAVDRYRVAYSNTNLALAQALADQGNLSDQDRETVTTLIQQAIREARAAGQINPNQAINWANLAAVYRQLINFAEGANQFAQAAYVRAIQLDPANPQLRLNLGGIFYTLNQTDPAIEQFRLAANLKPDFANAYYNLAYAYQKQEKWLEAYQAMEQAAALVPQDSPDRPKVNQELTDLKQKLPGRPETALDQPENQTPSLSVPPSPPEAPENFKPVDLNPLN